MPVPYRSRSAHGDARAGRAQRPALLLHPPDRQPRLRADGPEPARGAGRRDDRLLGVGRLPRRAGQAPRRAREGRLLAADQPRLADPRAKASGQYLNSVLAKIESLKAGYEEAILLDDQGHVCEGIGKNIYIVREGEIITPGQHNSILDGITRRSIIQIAATSATRSSSATSRAPRCTSPTRSSCRDRRRARAGVRDRQPQVGAGEPGEITRVLQKAFDDAIHGRTERYREWLDVVHAGDLETRAATRPRRANYRRDRLGRIAPRPVTREPPADPKPKAPDE